MLLTLIFLVGIPLLMIPACSIILRIALGDD